jgi:hypothetical protein
MQIEKPASHTFFTEAETSTYRSPPIPSLTLQGDADDSTTFKNCNIEVVNTRFFVETSPSSCFYVHYWNLVSIGSTSNGLHLMISDVIKNEKFDRNPALYEQQPELSKDELFENVKKMKNGQIELIGEYTLLLECPQISKEIYEVLNRMSGLCPDPPEYLELIGDEEPDLMGGGLGGADFDFEQGWQNLMSKEGKNLGKREFNRIGMDCEVVDLAGELKKLNAEEESDEN